MSTLIHWWQHLSFSQSGALLLTTLIVIYIIVTTKGDGA